MSNEITLFDILKIYFKYKLIFVVLFLFILLISLIVYFNNSHYHDFNSNFDLSSNKIEVIDKYYKEYFYDTSDYLNLLNNFYNSEEIFNIVESIWRKLTDESNFCFQSQKRKEIIDKNFIKYLKEHNTYNVLNIDIKHTAVYNQNVIFSIKNKNKLIDKDLIFNISLIEKTINKEFKDLFNECTKYIIFENNLLINKFKNYQDLIEKLALSSVNIEDKYIKNKIKFRDELSQFIKYLSNKNEKITNNNNIELKIRLKNIDYITVKKYLPISLYIMFSILIFFAITLPLSLYIFHKTKIT